MSTATAYYNEINPFPAQWLRNLIAEGLIAAGDVDERDIKEVTPDDLKGYTQAHFFAGIGGWSYALRLAGWPDDRPVWTGSCPCQPFSVAGKGKAFDDARHLWPAWFRLIRECRPSVVFGEQVARAVGWGWLDLVSADLEGCGYAVGSAVLPAASVGAPHKRDRLWFVADRKQSGLEGHARHERDGDEPGRERGDTARSVATSGPTRHMGHAESGDGSVPICERRPRQGSTEPGGAGPTRGVADAERASKESRRATIESREGDGAAGAGPHAQPGRCGDVGNPWADLVWLPCRDGKVRPTQPGIFPLAHGVPNRVGTLRGAGNAIVPQVAAAFIQAFLDCQP